MQSCRSTLALRICDQISLKELLVEPQPAHDEPRQIMPFVIAVQIVWLLSLLRRWLLVFGCTE